MAGLATALLGASAPAMACGGASPPSATSLRTAQASTRCLLNEQRRAHGLRPLALGRADLAGIAGRYAQQQAREGFVGHVDFDGNGVSDRFTRLRGDHWAEGENVAVGYPPLSSPRQIVTAFMDSPAHRANVLSCDYTEMAIGVRRTRPFGGMIGVVYVIEFVGRGSMSRRCRS